jgi:hypothetical protein
MTPLELAIQIIALVEAARTFPPSREVSLVIIKLQEAYLWVSEMQAIAEHSSELTPLSQENPHA